MNAHSPIKDYKHATLMKKFITDQQNDGFQFIGCEVFYNYFGARGVVDVLLRKDDGGTKTSTWLVCELKPALYDIGETIRQVRRAKEYFCKARPEYTNVGWTNIYKFVLILEASAYNYEQVKEFRELFSDIEIQHYHSDKSRLKQINNMVEIDRTISSISVSD